MTLFEVYDLLRINKSLQKIKQQEAFAFEKFNLILENTFLETSRYNRKRVVFFTQLKKCLLINDTLFFIEKNDKYLPVKINKTEMQDGSFERLLEELKKLNLKFEIKTSPNTI